MSNPIDSKNASSSPSGIDWKSARETVLDDTELLVTVIDAILEEWPSRIEDVRRAVATSDTTLLHRTTHTIKGYMRTFRVEEVITLTDELEQAFDGSNLDKTSTAIDQLCSQMQPVLAELEAFSRENGDSHQP